jgi:hypothetical protein
MPLREATPRPWPPSGPRTVDYVDLAGRRLQGRPAIENAFKEFLTEGDRWIIKTNAILPNGKKLAAANIITRNGPDAIIWQSKDRTLDGKALPDVGEI